MTKVRHTEVLTRAWCVEFWDFGAWNEWASTRRKYKAEAVALAQKMNRETTHENRIGAFEGHRFRVRRVRKEVS